jgi:hypothetical protein
MGTPTIAHINLWTEGLNEKWGLDVNNRRRINRGRLNIANLRVFIKRVRKRNQSGAECLLVLEGSGRYLEVHVNQRDLLLSNPQDPNYQNVTIQDKDIADYVQRYFTVSVEAAPFEWTSSFLLQCVTLVLVLVGLAFSLLFLSRFLVQESGFILPPPVLEISDAIEAANMIEEYSGLYATAVRDGGMLIELEVDGRFTYYDIRRSGHQRYILEPMASGTLTPVYEMDKAAFLTEQNYLFYPEEGKLVFQDRTYELVGQNRQDLPFIAFPD